jgi:glycine cleavage system H protein
MGGRLPDGIRFHRGHTWVRPISIDLAFVGATEFAVRFAGNLTELSLPVEFRYVRVGDPVWTFTSATGRKLTQLAPVGGLVLAVNESLLEDLTQLQSSPYRFGWIICLQSRSIPQQMRNLLSHQPDRVWFDRTCSTMRSVLGSALQLPAREDAWKPAFGEDFSDEEWECLSLKLFQESVAPGPEPKRKD